MTAVATNPPLSKGGDHAFIYAPHGRLAAGIRYRIDGYLAMVKTVVDSYYHDVTRYTSNAFLRVRLGEELEKRKIAPRVFKSASEAQASLPGTL